MTIPIERTNAISNTRSFLRKLLNPKETPRIPKKIRTEAYWCLRHFPNDYEIDRVAETKNSIFGKRDLK